MNPDKRAALFNSRTAMASLSCIFFAISIALRLFAHVYFPAGKTSFYLATQILLPLFSCAAFILLILIDSDNLLPISYLPLFAGILFFIMKAFEFEKTHQILCTALYILVGLIYILTASGIIRRKTLLILVFALPMIYHFGEDLYNRFIAAKPSTPSEWLMEFSVLAIMAALLCFSVSLETRYDRDQSEEDEDEIYDIFADIPIAARQKPAGRPPSRLVDEPIVLARTEKPEAQPAVNPPVTRSAISPETSPPAVLDVEPAAQTPEEEPSFSGTKRTFRLKDYLSTTKFD